MKTFNQFLMESLPIDEGHEFKKNMTRIKSLKATEKKLISDINKLSSNKKRNASLINTYRKNLEHTRKEIRDLWGDDLL